jgi:hypothetical protein
MTYLGNQILLGSSSQRRENCQPCPKTSWPVVVARSFQREILTVLPLPTNEMSQLGTDSFFIRNNIYKKIILNRKDFKL